MTDLGKVQLDRLHLTRIFAEQYNAVELMKNVELNNPSAKLPYHNNQHCFSVACNAVRNGLLENLPEHQIRLVFIAGLYHDWEHSGTADEQINIPYAVAGACAALKEAGESDQVQSAVESLIQSTSTDYPNSSRVTLMQKILHDADIMQNLEPDFEFFLEGLSEESGQLIDFASTKAYLQNHEWLTLFGRRRYVSSVFNQPS